MTDEIITETQEKELPRLTPKHAEFVDNYFMRDVHYNGTEAYQRTYPRCTRETARREAHKFLTNPDIAAHVQARFAELHLSKNEIMAQFADEARASLGEFFKETDEWVMFPRPTDEILDMEERVDDTDPEKPKTRIFYRVKRLVLDTAKVLDPRYSHLISKFVDRGKDGMSIELYDAQAARREVLRVQGAYKDKVDITSGDKPLKGIDDKQYDRAVSTFADAIRTAILGPDTKQDS